MPCIALLTDFGLRDWFVGAMKGVIAGIAPRAQVIDITHDIPPGDVRAGAFALWAAAPAFPKGTIFLAVVDPGVGGPRLPLLVEAGGFRFVGPDNGLLDWAAAGGRRIRALRNPAYRRKETSATFHGRDIFAPAAAHLARGARPASFGPALEAMEELPRPKPRRGPRGPQGEVLYVDRFGNAITSLAPADLPSGTGALRCRGRLFPLQPCYAQAGAGKPLAVTSSCGLMELAISGGSAASAFGLSRGDRVISIQRKV